MFFIIPGASLLPEVYRYAMHVAAGDEPKIKKTSMQFQTLFGIIMESTVFACHLCVPPAALC
jgi:hypothetical protein